MARLGALKRKHRRFAPGHVADVERAMLTLRYLRLPRRASASAARSIFPSFTSLVEFHAAGAFNERALVIDVLRFLRS
jgi:hypothetical protein